MSGVELEGSQTGGVSRGGVGSGAKPQPGSGAEPQRGPGQRPGGVRGGAPLIDPLQHEFLAQVQRHVDRRQST
eukprot:4474133-Prymnesium_polylepis.1